MRHRLAHPLLLVACAPWLAVPPVAVSLLVQVGDLPPSSHAGGPLAGFALVLLAATVCVGAVALTYRPAVALTALSCLLATSNLLLSKAGASVMGLGPADDTFQLQNLGIGVPWPVRLLIWVPPLLAGFWTLDWSAPAAPGSRPRSRPVKVVTTVWFAFAPTMIAWNGIQYVVGLWGGFLRVAGEVTTPQPVVAYLYMSAANFVLLVAGTVFAVGLWRGWRPALPRLVLVALLGVVSVVPWVMATLPPRSDCCEASGRFVNQVDRWLDLADVIPFRSMYWFEDVDLDLTAWVAVHVLTLVLLLRPLLRERRERRAARAASHGTAGEQPDPAGVGDHR